MKKEFRWLLLFVLLLALPGLACYPQSLEEQEQAQTAAQTESQPPAATEPSEAAPEGVAPDDTAAPDPVEETAAPTAVPAQEEDSTAAEATTETINLASVESTLNDLQSYHTLTVVRYGDLGGDDETSVSVATAVADSPAAHSVQVDFSGGSLAAMGRIMVVTVDNTTYTQVQGAPCIGVPAGLAGTAVDDPFLALADHDLLVGSIQGARRVMPNQTVNGVEARHYVFDQVTAQGSDFQFTSVNGELFLAEEGGHVVRYVVAARGRAGLLGVQDGDVHVTFDVTDINQPLTVSAPDGCVGSLPGGGSLPGIPSGLPGLPGGGGSDQGSGGSTSPAPTTAPTSGFPIMPDAYNRLTSSNTDTYNTNYSYGDVVEFYRQEMVAAGWTLYHESPTPHSIILEFSRSGVNARVTISDDPTVSYVNVLIGWR